MTRTIALIGAGPRALGALEALARLPGPARPRVTLFDPTPWPGAGANFAPDQSVLCLLNVALRGIDLPASPVGFPDLADWLGACDPDRYPQRAELGAYLMARLAALIEGGPLAVVRDARRIDRIAPDAGGWRVGDARFDQVLLVPGQPRSRPDDQLARWMAHRPDRVVPAYPDHRLLRRAQGWAGRTVAVRGLGLSTMDVLRLLTEGLGGRFRDGTYHRSGREPARILPFSLDGLPPFPKPGSQALDRALDPLPEETDAFRRALDHALTLPPDAAAEALIPAMARAAARILGCDPAIPAAWLRQEIRDPASQHRGGPRALLDHGIAMASGRAAPDAGYVIGALWRKWQNPLRRAFNPADPPAPTAKALIALDEGLKRYSYGPPLDMSERLAALIDAGLVDPRAADDPDIMLTDRGWRLEGATRAEADVMVDAVLPPPALDRLDDPLLLDLRRRGLARAHPAGPGLDAGADGVLIGDRGPVPGLAALGRITMGRVIAADSIHDCFGAAADRWAAMAAAGA